MRIGYTIGENHWGEPSVFCKVLVRDEAAKPIERLRDLANSLSVAMMNEIRIDENGLSTYFNYRTVSEQETLHQDPNWNQTLRNQERWDIRANFSTRRKPSCTRYRRRRPRCGGQTGPRIRT